MKRRILATVLVLCLLLGLVPGTAWAADGDFSASPADNASIVWDGSVADGYAGGSGTSKDPYLIATAAQLARVAEQVNSGTESGKYYRLANDIYLNDVSSVGSWNITAPLNQWTPIGSASSPFSGIFDGADHIIGGIYISTTDNYQGLFGMIGKNSSITNIGVEKSYIKGGDFVSGLCGYSASSFSNCYSGATVDGNKYLGGIVGGAGNPGGIFGGSQISVDNCFNTGKINGTSYVGGILGNADTGVLTKCYNVGAIAGTNRVGGITGRTVETHYCWNLGDVTGADYTGGILGEAAFFGLDQSKVTSCFNAGAVKGKSYTGGIVGYASAYSWAYKSDINNCYNVGAIHADGDYVAGIAGSSDRNRLKNCYNAGICTFGKSPNSDAIFNVANSSSNLYYLAGCCGENYSNYWTDTVKEMTSSAMQESSFVATLNNGGSAWAQDTNGYNSGYPILSGIDYKVYWDQITSLKSYTLKIIGDKQTNCLALNDSLQVYAGWYLGDLLDASIRDSILVTSDSQIVDIAVGDWDESCGRQYTFLAKGVGQAVITFTNPQNEIAVPLNLYVVENESGFSFDHIPQMEIEEYKVTNFYNYAGLVVDEYSYTPHYIAGTDTIDYYLVSMNVYNISNAYGAVSAYTSEGRLKGFNIIDKKEPLATSFLGSIKDLFFNIGDLYYLLDNEQYYSGESISKKQR